MSDNKIADEQQQVTAEVKEDQVMKDVAVVE